MVVAGNAIAVSRPTTDKYKYQRSYPGGSLYEPVTGYFSLLYGSSALERAEDGVLSGEDDRLFVRRVSDLVTGRTPRGGDLVLTLNPDGQAAAFRLLGARRGAVVALDPHTGAILTMVSSPSYDPNVLSSHDTSRIQRAWAQLNANPGRPLVNRALNETFPIGSTMKVIISAAALQSGYTPTTMIDSPRTYTPPQTSRPLPNYEGEVCSSSGHQQLIDALTVSCNTAFAELGVKLGADKIRAQAALFGVGDGGLTVPMSVSTSQLGDLADPPKVAQSSIGQRDVRFTPLQEAMVAAAVANDGVLEKPYLIQEIRAPGFATLDRAQPTVLHRPMPPDVAAELQLMMRRQDRHSAERRARPRLVHRVRRAGQRAASGRDRGDPAERRQGRLARGLDHRRQGDGRHPGLTRGALTCCSPPTSHWVRATGCCPASRSAGWARCGGPRTRSWAGRSPSRC